MKKIFWENWNNFSKNCNKKKQNNQIIGQFTNWNSMLIVKELILFKKLKIMMLKIK